MTNFKFKVGDIVVVIKGHELTRDEDIGIIGKITRIGNLNSKYPYILDCSDDIFDYIELRLATDEEIKEYIAKEVVREL